jgi:sulfofructose kinase
VSAPGFKVDVVSTLGAGDVFHGALMAQVVEGRPMAEALRRANAVAALSCLGLDGQSAIPTAQELNTYLEAQS